MRNVAGDSYPGLSFAHLPRPRRIDSAAIGRHKTAFDPSSRRGTAGLTVHAGNYTGFFFNQIKWTVSDSEDTGHRDTKPIGGLFVKIDRSADNSEAGHRTGALWKFRVCPTPLQPRGWVRITKPDTLRRG